MTGNILDSFNPFATHPFTNGSGLMPEPPMPSQYGPIAIPAPRSYGRFPPTPYPSLNNASTSPSSPPSLPVGSPQSSPYVRAPQPRPIPISSPPSQPSSTGPTFVPFRQETSSPDLVLRRKPSQKASQA